MAKDDRKKNNRKGAGFTAGAVGAIAGAALGAAAVALSDKKTRKKVMNTVNTLKDKAFDTVNQMQKEVKFLKEKAQEKLDEEKNSK